MKSFQFTVCVVDEEGYNIQVNGLLTPIVIANNFWEAVQHEETLKYCAMNNVRVYRQVGR